MNQPIEKEVLNTAPSENEQVTRAAGIVGLATLSSRILGAVRDMVIASFFGAGLVSDAFLAAFRFPNLLRRLFGEGSLSLVFVPVFTDCLYTRGQAEADRLAGSALRLLALLLAFFSLAGILAAPLLVRILAPGFVSSAGKYALTVHLTRIMMPYLFFIGLVALCMGILNVLGHFASPALAPTCLNLAMIAAVLGAALLQSSMIVKVICLAVGVVIGGVLQLGLQLPFLVRHGIRFWRGASLWHPDIRKVLLLMGPVIFGAAVYQINSLVITLLATLLPEGSVSYLYFADRLVQFPLGVFAIAAATAVLPSLSRQATAGQWEALRDTFAHALRLVFFITLPCMVGLLVLRTQIVTLLFQRGVFDAHSTRLTASALLYYGMGLWSFAAVRIVLNLFYALQDTRTPVRMAVVSVILNIVFSAALMGPMQHNGLALALTLSSTANLVLLIWALRRKMGPFGWRGITVSAGKSGLCAAVMGIGVWALAARIAGSQASGFGLLAGLTCSMAAGVAIFAFMAFMLRLPELTVVLQMAGKRVNKK